MDTLADGLRKLASHVTRKPLISSLSSSLALLLLLPSLVLDSHILGYQLNRLSLHY